MCPSFLILPNLVLIYTNLSDLKFLLLLLFRKDASYRVWIYVYIYAMTINGKRSHEFERKPRQVIWKGSEGGKGRGK